MWLCRGLQPPSCCCLNISWAPGVASEGHKARNSWLGLQVSAAKCRMCVSSSGSSPPTPLSPFPPVLLNIDLVIKILTKSGPAAPAPASLLPPILMPVSAPEPWQCHVPSVPSPQDEGRTSRRESRNSRLQKLSPERHRPELKSHGPYVHVPGPKSPGSCPFEKPEQQ